MRRSAGKARGCAEFDPHGCVGFLRARHQTKTAAGVEAAAGVPARTVERWLTFDATPNARALGRLIAAYGPAFLDAALPGLAWVRHAADLADYETMGAEIAARQRHQAQLGRAIFGERP